MDRGNLVPKCRRLPLDSVFLAFRRDFGEVSYVSVTDSTVGLDPLSRSPSTKVPQIKKRCSTACIPHSTISAHPLRTPEAVRWSDAGTCCVVKTRDQHRICGFPILCCLCVDTCLMPAVTVAYTALRASQASWQARGRFVYSIFITKLVRESQDPADRWAYGENFELLTNTMVTRRANTTEHALKRNSHTH